MTLNYSLLYDGSFEGFLSAVYQIYDRKILHVNFYRGETLLPAMFENIISIDTNDEHAERVWKGFQKKVGAVSAYSFYASFLSELEGIENSLLAFMQYVFLNSQPVDSNFGNAHVLRIAQVNKMVRREKHRMEAFVRFQLTADGIYYAAIEPDFNVLPLIKKHFTQRYADQQWIIYDLRRRYGLFYDLHKTETVQIDFSENVSDGVLEKNLFDPSEEMYQKLWKAYFKSVNIPSRKNMKLHLRHVPTRYWKYLTEKVE